MDSEGLFLPESAVAIVRWPDLEPIASERTAESEAGRPRRVVVSPTDALAPGWYATRVEFEGARANAVDALPAGDGVLARFGVAVQPQIASARAADGLVVLRFSEPLANSPEWTGVSVAAAGRACELLTAEGPATELVFDCQRIHDIAISVGAGVTTARGGEVRAFEGSVSVENLHRFEPM